MLIKSPSGKYVELPDDEAEKWLEKGFTKITGDEASEHQLKRSERLKSLNRELGEKLIDEHGNEIEIYFSSVYEGNDGYGTSRKQIKDELTALGMRVSEHYEGQKIGLLYHSPYSIKRLDTPIKILFTMFESDRIPDDWIPYLKEIDKIIVPSEWVADAFRDRGFFPEVVPLGYDQRTFSYKQRKTPIEEKRDFIFLHYNAFNIRKGFPEVLKAFVKEFRHDEPVKMIFKTTLENPPLPLPPTQYPNIKVMRGSVRDNELAELCQSADCFVFPSRGEGFGITPLEAMGTGCPAIIPNAHGISEYFNADCMYEVEVEKTCPALYSRYKGMDVGNMVICDVDDLAKKMRLAYQKQKYNLEMGEKAAEYVKKYSYKKTAKRLYDIFAKMNKTGIKASSNYLKLEAI